MSPLSFATFPTVLDIVHHGEREQLMPIEQARNEFRLLQSFLWPLAASSHFWPWESSVLCSGAAPKGSITKLKTRPTHFPKHAQKTLRRQSPYHLLVGALACSQDSTAGSARLLSSRWNILGVCHCVPPATVLSLSSPKRLRGFFGSSISGSPGLGPAPRAFYAFGNCCLGQPISLSRMSSRV